MIRLVLGVALTFAVSVPALAQVKADTAPQRFDAADTNDDGKVDRTEYDGFVEELVLLHDTDHDGKLTREELSDAPDLDRFSGIDLNMDGFLNVAELAFFSDNDFKIMDANSDGTIDRDEAAQKH